MLQLCWPEMSRRIRDRYGFVAKSVLALGLALGVTFCGDGVTLPGEGEPAAIAIVKGDGQGGTVARPLTDSLAVKVTDSKGRPVAQVRVAFVVTLGGGQTLPDTATTNSTGRAASQWVLGNVAGAQAVEARVVGATAPLKAAFGATVQSGPISATGSTVSASPSSIPLFGAPSTITVTVKDNFGNAISGANVVPTPTSSVTFSPTHANSNGSGVATFSFSAAAAGGYTVSARAGAVSITQTATVTVTKAIPTLSLTISVANPFPGVVAVQASWTVTSSSGTPTGNVSVTDGTDSCGPIALAVQQSCSYIASHSDPAATFTMLYSGDTNFQARTAQQTNVNLP